jgi:hypothetical protein
MKIFTDIPDLTKAVSVLSSQAQILLVEKNSKAASAIVAGF